MLRVNLVFVTLVIFAVQIITKMSSTPTFEPLKNFSNLLNCCKKLSHPVIITTQTKTNNVKILTPSQKLFVEREISDHRVLTTDLT
jgi:predicted regulator of amino acid metabolism with ACT domain